MEEFEMREIRATDNLQLSQLIKGVLEEFKANRSGTAYFDESTNHLFELFQKERCAYWVIEKEGEILAAGGVYPTDGLPTDTCELVKLYAKPAARGLGLGKRLIMQCFESARAFGYTTMYLESMPELNQAVKLYERLGFVHQNKPAGNSGHFGCDIWMLKNL